MRRSARIEKRSIPEGEHTRGLKPEKSLGVMEAAPEENAQPQRARPGPESVETQSSRSPAGRAGRSQLSLCSTRAKPDAAKLVINRDASVDDGENERRKPVLYHNISEGGPKLKNIAELLADADPYQNFNIPSNKIIASKNVDRIVCHQMRRLAPNGNLTPERVRNNLADSIRHFESWWDLRSKRESRPLFWKRVCMRSTWMSQLDGADCREFFLWLVVYFRRGSGKKATNKLTKAFEVLSELFEMESDCELQELAGIESRVQLPANQSLGRSRAAVSKKKNSKSKPVDGNIFHLSGDTNMTDYELRGVDIQGLTPIRDIGGRRRKDEDHKRMFEEEMEADRARMAEEAAQKAATEKASAMDAAMTPEPHLTTQIRKRSSRKRATPFEAGTNFSDFEDMYEEDEDDEEEMPRAAALKRQRLL